MHNFVHRLIEYLGILSLLAFLTCKWLTQLKRPLKGIIQQYYFPVHLSEKSYGSVCQVFGDFFDERLCTA